MHLILTGSIGSGKSTTAKQIRERLSWVKVNGFYTRRHDHPDQPSIVAMGLWDNSPPVTVARIHPSPTPLSPSFDVDTDALNRLAQRIRDPVPSRPVLIDELGLLEWASDDFVEATASLFAHPTAILAVIQERALDRWVERIGHTRIGRIERIDPSTRDRLPDILLPFFSP